MIMSIFLSLSNSFIISHAIFFFLSIDYEVNNNYIGSGVAPNHHNYHHQHHHYPEPPEPIIEIIIQDNNETLPEPQPIVQSNGKKKKEQVQVFYVKYHKDEKKGLVIHEPVAALSPAGHEQHEEDDHHHEELTIVTPVPHIPRKSTTLRTIIRPESEHYESSSGVHVTFNKPHNHHSKSDNHIHDEEKVESAIQPVIQLPQNRLGPLAVLPIKEKRQQPIPPPFSTSSLNQGRVVNHQVPNFHHQQPQQLVQNLPNQRPHVDFNPQNNFIAHPHQGFLSTQLTLPSQDPIKPFHPNSSPSHHQQIPHQHQQQTFARPPPQQPLSIPINHQQPQQQVLGHQQPLLKPPQRLPPPPVNFNQNQRPFNFHAHQPQQSAPQAQAQVRFPQQPPPQQPPQFAPLPPQRQQQLPPRQAPPSFQHNNFNQQLPPLNRPPVQFNGQFSNQQQFPPHQGPPLNFKPEPKIPPPQQPQQPHSQPLIQHNQFLQHQQQQHNVFQGGLTEQAAPNLGEFHYKKIDLKKLNYYYSIISTTNHSSIATTSKTSTTASIPIIAARRSLQSPPIHPIIIWQ